MFNLEDLTDKEAAEIYLRIYPFFSSSSYPVEVLVRKVGMIFQKIWQQHEDSINPPTTVEEALSNTIKPVGVVLKEDEIGPEWHIKLIVDWEQLGNGSIVYGYVNEKPKS